MPVYSVPRNWASSRRPTNDCIRARDARRSASTRSSCSTCFSSARAGSFMVSKPRLAADRRQRLLQVEPRGGPITGGHGDAGAVEELLPLLLEQGQPALRSASSSRCRARRSFVIATSSLPRRETLCQTMKSTMLKTASVLTAQERHDRRPAFAPFPGAFPGRRRPGVNRVAVHEPAADRRPARRALANRRAGSFSRHFRQIVSRSCGTRGSSCRGGTGSCSITWRIVSIGLPALNGGRPTSSSYRIAPSE